MGRPHVFRDKLRPAIPVARRDSFSRRAAWAVRFTGGRWGFRTALGMVILWAASGHFFHYSESWPVLINTLTSTVTFLMVFLIQNAQNRESKATHLKLDELILSINRARNELIDIEKLSEEQLDLLAERYSKVARQHRHKLTECFAPDEGPDVPPG